MNIIVKLGSASRQTRGNPPVSNVIDGVGPGKVVKCLPSNWHM